jgi:hypothetical protein
MSRTYQVIFVVGSVLVLAVLAYWLFYPAVAPVVPAPPVVTPQVDPVR